MEINKYHLQNRWKLDNKRLIYYGLRNKENLFNNTFKLNNKQIVIIKELPKVLNNKELKIVKKILGESIVLEKDLKIIPKSFDDAQFCTNCVANDFMIPGLEFDEMGNCPMCQTKDDVKDLKSILPIMNIIPKSKKSRFDIGLFFTGGKDSTFLLHYLSVVLDLKVLAMTWEIPFMSVNSLKSIENAKKKLKNVEFISRKINEQDLIKFYNKLYSLSGNTCACPSLAYVMFYSDLVDNKVPYFVAGNEPVQMLGLYYNHLAPKLAYTFSNNKLLNFMINVGRIITFHPPFKKGQMQTLATMKQLAYSDNIFKKISGYSSDLISNVVTSIKEIKHITIPLKRSIRRSSWSGNIPAFIHIDFNDISDGNFNWKNAKKTIEDECGWVGPSDSEKSLHTSCNIEKCKEYSQFTRFYNMESTMIPFSALEIALASSNKHISIEDAVKEMKESLGFSLKEIPECKIMKSYLKNKNIVNGIVYFSASKETKSIAKYFREKTNYQLIDLTSYQDRNSFDYTINFNNLVLCFPVYSQNIPEPVNEILANIKSRNTVLIATYGKMGTGNVLYEAAKYFENIIGAAYVPTKHTYLENERFNDFQKLDSLVNRILSKDKIKISIPERKKSFLANISPKKRSQLSVLITVNDNCIECGICTKVCPTKSIINGHIDNTCIRCLRCVNECPSKALDVKYSYPLRKYLQTEKINELIIY
ncbi:MAG TPA: hypothetical protein GX695_00905 [Acholeplasmataceae bacterium]|nr:hypothetical protein [Acholeplasmataceae bacterium]